MTPHAEEKYYGSPPDLLFDKLVAYLSSSLVRVQKHMEISSSSDSIVRICDPEYAGKHSTHTAVTVPAVLMTHISVYKLAEAPRSNENWRNIID